MNNASTRYQEHLPKFDIIFNSGVYFREKKTNFYSNREIKITNPDQFNFYNTKKNENNNEINKNIMNKNKSKKIKHKNNNKNINQNSNK